MNLSSTATPFTVALTGTTLAYVALLQVSHCTSNGFGNETSVQSVSKLFKKQYFFVGCNMYPELHSVHSLDPSVLYTLHCGTYPLWHNLSFK